MGSAISFSKTSTWGWAGGFTEAPGYLSPNRSLSISKAFPSIFPLCIRWAPRPTRRGVAARLNPLAARVRARARMPTGRAASTFATDGCGVANSTFWSRVIRSPRKEWLVLNLTHATLHAHVCAQTGGPAATFAAGGRVRVSAGEFAHYALA